MAEMAPIKEIFTASAGAEQGTDPLHWVPPHFLMPYLSCHQRKRYPDSIEGERGNGIMFNKKNDDATDYDRAGPTVREAPNMKKRKTSVIGPTLRFKGELSANEDLIIEGQIEGVIAHHEKNLTVGKEGRVKADIAARTVEIYGYVEGDVRGEEIVKLAESAVVKGNIFCARIVMANGAQFTGNIDMSQKTKSSGKPTSPQIKQPVEAVKIA